MVKGTTMTRRCILVLGLVSAVVLGACRQEEANRPTSFTPGVYKGEAMPTLNRDQIAELAKRGQLLK
jgi:hypothetical protein